MAYRYALDHLLHPSFREAVYSSEEMTQGKPNIAIVGGGISGATLAIALIRRGINVTVYEQAHAFGEVGNHPYTFPS